MKRACFTLIELLVVIATIALLMAILVPSLQNSRQQAKAVLCSSNIKQLLLGLFSYESDHDTLPHAFDNTPMFPPSGGYAGNSAFDKIGWWWFNYMDGYFSKDKAKRTVLSCPSRQIRNRKLKDDILCGNYGVNQSICKIPCGFESQSEFIGMPLHSSDISRPTETLLIIDSGYSMINWRHATDTPPVPFGSAIEDTAYIPGLRINEEKDLWPGQKRDAIKGRHPNKSVNVGFADGHINRTKADDLVVEKTNNNYKNRRLLWLPK
jgi:prepilin-type processing-associated H-X9-DG protein